LVDKRWDAAATTRRGSPTTSAAKTEGGEEVAAVQSETTVDNQPEREPFNRLEDRSRSSTRHGPELPTISPMRAPACAPASDALLLPACRTVSSHMFAQTSVWS
jgi:hypothetical protein